jgi:hypothetical protein
LIILILQLVVVKEEQARKGLMVVLDKVCNFAEVGFVLFLLLLVPMVETAYLEATDHTVPRARQLYLPSITWTRFLAW